MNPQGKIDETVIVSAKWDSASWRGVLYIIDPTLARPPIFGLIFRNEAAAIDIFTGWRKQVGREDENDWIRVAVIEGDVPNQDKGYTVHIGPNPTQNQAEFDEGMRLLKTYVSRVFRMNPHPNSKNLPNFKNAFSRKGKLFLTPVIASEEHISPSNLRPLVDYGITKSNLILRNSADVKKNDIDSVIFTKGL